MALILNIDTSVNSGSVCLSRNGKSIGYLENTEPGQQASWLHKAIKQIMSEANTGLKSLNAIAVANGPGSYTGLRIGLSAAKGICYALNIPLITVNTLIMMASAVADRAEELICPMIDARRMEVFTALFDKHLTPVQKPKAMILKDDSFSDILKDHRILFAGNGSLKYKGISEHSNANFVDYTFSARDLVPISSKMFEAELFTGLAYSEPEYLKAVHTT